MLTSAQISHFKRQGYLVVPDITPAKTLSDVWVQYGSLIDDLYDRWFAEGRVTQTADNLDFWGKLLEAYRAKCDWFQLMDISLPGDRILADTPFHMGPAIFDLLTAKPLLDVVEQFIGPELTSNPIQHVRIKPPMDALKDDEIRPHIAATDWHQDRAVALEDADETEMITVWIAMTDATVENGCLQVQPKTAEQTILPHCPKKQTGIADGFVNKKTAIPLPVKAGGVVLFHPLTPHSSLKNVTDGFRRSFDIRFNKTRQSTGRSHFPEFIVRSASDPDRELRDWVGSKAMWEDARARLSKTPHIDIHRWSTDAPYCA